jgi:hypothetical protein
VRQRRRPTLSLEMAQLREPNEGKLYNLAIVAPSFRAASRTPSLVSLANTLKLK